MKFHLNHLADNHREMFKIFLLNKDRISQNLSYAAVLICTSYFIKMLMHVPKAFLRNDSFVYVPSGLNICLLKNAAFNP